MKHILLALFLITSAAHGALTKVPGTMATAGVAIVPGATTQMIFKSAVLTCGTSSAIVNFGLGGVAWMTSLTNISSGTCNLTITAGTWPTGSYWCSISPRFGATSGSNVWKIREVSSTLIDIGCYNANAACTNPGESVNIFCWGY